MTQVVRISAVNFGDLLKLKKAVNDILLSLRYIDKKPDFRSASVLFSFIPSGVFVKIEARGCDEDQTPKIPEGVTADDWAELISLELSNLLLSGDYFIAKKTRINKAQFEYEVTRASRP